MEGPMHDRQRVRPDDRQDPGRPPWPASWAAPWSTTTSSSSAAAAALIFPHVFFPDDDTSALVMSFATFGFAYVARPFGAVILGHFGDRVGRQKVLMFTLVLMGVSTFTDRLPPDVRPDRLGRPGAAGLLPAAAGSVRGRRAGGRQLADPRARPRRPPLASSPRGRSPAPRAARSSPRSSFIPVVALPDEIKYSWGWRIPFWFSALVVVVAYFIRRSLHETAVVRGGQGQRRDRQAAGRSTCCATTGATCCA